MKNYTHDSNMQELLLSKLKEEYDEVRQDIDFAVENRLTLDFEIKTLRERRLRLGVEIAESEKRLSVRTRSTQSEMDHESRTGVPKSGQSGQEIRLVRLEKQIQDINERLTTDED